MKIAVILARSKSKRIIKKNIKIFCGKPIIAWPILAARKTKIFDRIIVFIIYMEADGCLFWETAANLWY